jgi:tetratricopeptide (TPR) repeat protein
MLADMLILSGRPAEALTHYLQSLLSDPNRFNALLGAGQAAEQLGRINLAERYHRTLLANCGQADDEAIKEIQHTRTILPGH